MLARRSTAGPSISRKKCECRTTDPAPDRFRLGLALLLEHLSDERVDFGQLFGYEGPDKGTSPGECALQSRGGLGGLPDTLPRQFGKPGVARVRRTVLRNVTGFEGTAVDVALSKEALRLELFDTVVHWVRIQDRNQIEALDLRPCIIVVRLSVCNEYPSV
jgi:hypothetical protein